MGNRAVITRNTNPTAPCIYLHWNGGRDSVEGFLMAAKAAGFKNDTAKDWDAFANYLAAYFFECQVGMTIYREPYGRADTTNSDNGTYLVNAQWDIVQRLHAPQREQRVYNPADILADILDAVAQSEPV